VTYGANIDGDLKSAALLIIIELWFSVNGLNTKAVANVSNLSDEGGQTIARSKTTFTTRLVSMIDAWFVGLSMLVGF